MHYNKVDLEYAPQGPKRLRTGRHARIPAEGRADNMRKDCFE